jgi:hypothetical protein
MIQEDSFPFKIGDTICFIMCKDEEREVINLGFLVNVYYHPEKRVLENRSDTIDAFDVSFINGENIYFGHLKLERGSILGVVLEKSTDSPYGDDLVYDSGFVYHFIHKNNFDKNFLSKRQVLIEKNNLKIDELNG